MNATQQANEIRRYENKFKSILRLLEKGRIDLAKEKCELYMNGCGQDRKAIDISERIKKRKERYG